MVKPINNRWTWGMVPEGGAARQAELNVQGIHNNPVSGNYQTPSH